MTCARPYTRWVWAHHSFVRCGSAPTESTGCTPMLRWLILSTGAAPSCSIGPSMRRRWDSGAGRRRLPGMVGAGSSSCGDASWPSRTARAAARRSLACARGTRCGLRYARCRSRCGPRAAWREAGFTATKVEPSWRDWVRTAFAADRDGDGRLRLVAGGGRPRRRMADRAGRVEPFGRGPGGRLAGSRRHVNQRSPKLSPLGVQIHSAPAI